MKSACLWDLLQGSVQGLHSWSRQAACDCGGLRGSRGLIHAPVALILEGSQLL